MKKYIDADKLLEAIQEQVYRFEREAAEHEAEGDHFKTMHCLTLARAALSMATAVSNSMVVK